MFSLKELNQDFFKGWETRVGFCRITGMLSIIVPGFIKIVVSNAGITIPWGCYIGCFFIVVIICFALWILERKGFYYRKKIRIGIHPHLLKEDPNLEKVLRNYIKSCNVGCLIKVDVIPSDVCMDCSQNVEKYINDHGYGLIIWGDSFSGKESGKETIQYVLHFSYSYGYMAGQKKSVGYVLSKDFRTISSERYWKVQKENALAEIQVIGTNLVEVSLYIIGICILSKGNLKRGVMIFDNLFWRLNDPNKRKLQLYYQVRNHLISLYNFLSVVEWAEMRNKPMSRLYAEKALVIDDNNYDCHARLALYDYLDGNTLGARRHLKRCETINKKHPCTLFDKAFFCILDKKYKSAAKIYKQIEKMPIDGFMAFEVAAFLEQEYEKHKEIAFLFGIGMLSLKFVGHVEYGVSRLKEFLLLVKGRSEYDCFYGKAETLLREYKI